MQTIKVIGRGFVVGPGALMRLTRAQLAHRAHEVDPVEGRADVYTPRVPQQFKVGEVLGLEAIDVGQRQMVEPFETDEEKTAREKAEAAQAARDKAAAAAAARARAALEKTWSESWARSDDLKAQFPNVEDYIAGQRRRLDEV